MAIPESALDDRLAFVGTSGSGKTYGAGTAVERLLASRARVVIVDPLDVWWGLRLREDGVTPSIFAPIIFGGEHGDLPLNEHAGALIGETVVTMGESCIISLSGMPSKSAERRFMLAMLDAMYRKATGEPFHLIFDEADLWAPQRPNEKDGFSARLQGQMEGIVRRGRVKGFIPWLITQRPAVLSKDVLSQADGLIAFKLTSSQDRDAVGAWIEGQADRAQGKEILGSLPAMQRGEGIVWIPGRGVLETTRFPQKTTFDSSRTPARGEVKRARSLKPLDIGKLQTRLASLVEEAQANDPTALKAEVARLTKALAKVKEPVSAPASPESATAAYTRGKGDGYAEGVREGQRSLAGLLASLEPLERAIAVLKGESPKVEAWTKRQPPISPMAKEAAALVTPAARVTGPGQRILDALAWWSAFGISQPTNEQVAFIAGYSPTSTGYTNPRSALRTAGLIEYPSVGVVALTSAGHEKTIAPSIPPTVDEMHRRVMGKLSGPQQRILTPLINAHPASLTNAEVAEQAGYSATSTGYTNPRSSLRTLSLIEYPTIGQVRAADWLFPAPAHHQRSTT